MMMKKYLLALIITLLSILVMPYHLNALDDEGIVIKGLVEKAYYTGKPITLNLELYDNDQKLVLNKDYSLSYKNNTKVGQATITIKGKGNYSGTIVKTFEIANVNDEGAIALSAKKNPIVLEYDSIIYSGLSNKPDVEVKDKEGNPLVEGRDYILTFGANTDVGSGTVNIIGINGYKGVIVKKFKILAFPIAEAVVGGSLELEYHKTMNNSDLDIVANGKKLVINADYKTSIKGQMIKITGINNYTGSYYLPITIRNCDISTLEIVENDVIYKSRANNFRTGLIINDNGRKLSPKTDYENVIYTYGEDTEAINHLSSKNKVVITRLKGETVSSKDQVPVGTLINVKASGKGKYEGIIEGEYRVVEKTIAKTKATVASFCYTGEEIRPDKSAIVLMDGKYQLNESQYEIISYANNLQTGKGQLTIRGLGEYGGRKTISFTIEKKALALERTDLLECSIRSYVGGVFPSERIINDGIIYQKEEVYSPAVEIGLVIYQSANEGSLPYGSLVTVYVSKGDEPKADLLSLDDYQSFCAKETRDALLKVMSAFSNISFFYEESEFAIGSIISISVDGDFNYEPGKYYCSVPIVITITDKTAE